MDEEILNKCGLTEDEVKVYFAVRSLGEETLVGRAGYKAGVASRNIMSVLDSLIKKDLMSKVTKGDCDYYTAHPIAELMVYICGSDTVCSKDISNFRKYVKELGFPDDKDLEGLHEHEQNIAGG